LSSVSENIFRISAPAHSPVFVADESLNTGTAGTCDLLLLLDRQTVSIALKERKANRILAVESFHSANLFEDFASGSGKLSQQSRILRTYPFQKVTVAVASNQFTLIPEALYREEDASKYYAFNFTPSPAQKILSQGIRTFQARVVYSIPNEVNEYVSSAFRDPLLLPHIAPLLESARQWARGNERVSILFNVRNSSLDIVIAENSKLILANSFNWREPEDALYYLLFTCEQLGLDPQRVPVWVSGNAGSGTAINKLLEKYIRSTEICALPPVNGYSHSVALLPAQLFYSLFCLPLCES